VNPASLWKVNCVGAAIAQTKPNGDPWDGFTGSLAGPDPQCAFWLGNSLAAQTSVISNTFAPDWNESITPTSRFSASLLSSQSSPWSIRVTDDDQTAGADAICSVSPVLDTTALVSGMATFTAGSCTSLEIALTCVSP
jgi:C2 domain